jgi:hypothetical protein
VLCVFVPGRNVKCISVWVLVAHDCNPSLLEAEMKRIVVQGQSRQIVQETVAWKNPTHRHTKAGRVAQVEQCLCSKHEPWVQTQYHQKNTMLFSVWAGKREGEHRVWWAEMSAPDWLADLGSPFAPLKVNKCSLFYMSYLHKGKPAVIFITCSELSYRVLRAKWWNKPYQRLSKIV